MTDAMFPKPTAHLVKRREALAPEVAAAFHGFSKAVFQEGALSRKHKQLIAVAVAHVTQCPYCIRGHTKAAAREGATRAEVMEAIWVAAEMRAGGAYAHSLIALDALDAPDAPDALDERHGHASHG
ncbi:MAG TPA: carboxymuconolactone decarboxylase family protein [Polyangiaceae bacterium]|nr:carboxymuconolactone decarboxylase family protein [Polyangiaceae bacterium]